MMGSIFAFVISSYVFVDTLNIYAFKKVYDKGDSILIGVNISPYILVFKKDEKGFSGGIRIDFNAKLEDNKDYFIRFFKRIEYETYEETREKENKIQFSKWVKINGVVKEVNIRVNDLNSQKEWNFKNKFFINNIIETGSFLFFRRKENKIEYLLPPLGDTSVNVLFTFKSKEEGRLRILVKDKENTFYEDSNSFKEGLGKVLFDLNMKKIRSEKLNFNILFKTANKEFKFENDIYIKPIDIFAVYEWNDILNALNLIFARSDLEVFYKVQPEDRRKVWDEFWKKYDPDPVTPHNELEIEFLDRFQYVMKNFSGPLKGYRTDRGRIYIKYGPPDYIEDHPYEWGTYPYQIWYYINLGKRFLFVDRTGFGDYELTTDLRDIYPQYR